MRSSLIVVPGMMLLVLCGCRTGRRVVLYDPPVTRTAEQASNDRGPAVIGTQRSTKQAEATGVPAERTEQAAGAQSAQSGSVADIYFEYNRSLPSPDQSTVLSREIPLLRRLVSETPISRLQIEGHADDRGSAAYNLALAERRATVVKERLVESGVPEAQIQVISYGKERPQCEELSDDCRARNRRAHFAKTP